MPNSDLPFLIKQLTFLYKQKEYFLFLEEALEEGCNRTLANETTEANPSASETNPPPHPNGAFSLNRRPSRFRNLKRTSDLPETDVRREEIQKILSRGDFVSGSRVIQEMQRLFKVTPRFYPDGGEQFPQLIRNDIYLMEKSECLEVRGTGKGKEFKFRPGSIPDYRITKKPKKKEA